MKPLVVVQARTGSTRLPGKVLKDLGGIPMLAFQLRRLRPIGERIVVATSDRPGDDVVEAIAHAEGVDAVRGSESDVLARFAQALDAYPDTTHLVRLTADCPLSDPEVVRSVLDRLVDSGADYASNVHPRSFPQGLDAEACTAAALRTAAAEATDPYDREHVTPFLYRNPDRFTVANVDSGCDLGDIGWTVDTADDLDRVRGIVERLDDPLVVGWRHVAARVGLDAADRSGGDRSQFAAPLRRETP